LVELTKVKDIKDFGYYGTHGDWFLAMGYCEIGDLLDKANFSALVQQLEDRADRDDWTVEGFGGWMGHGEHLLVAPDTEAYHIARTAQQFLTDEYPVLNEDLLSEMETEVRLENTKMALQEYGYPTGDGVVSEVYTLCCDNPPTNEDEPGYLIPGDFYPSKAACFLGYLHHRRFMKGGN